MKSSYEIHDEDANNEKDTYSYNVPLNWPRNESGSHKSRTHFPQECQPTEKET